MIDELLRENTKLKAEIEALAPDAERYRWLRDNASCQWGLDYQHIEVVFPLLAEYDEWDDMDDAVDRAIEAAALEKGGAA